MGTVCVYEVRQQAQAGVVCACYNFLNDRYNQYSAGDRFAGASSGYVFFGKADVVDKRK